jgi:hypothetical protein
MDPDFQEKNKVSILLETNQREKHLDLLKITELFLQLLKEQGFTTQVVHQEIRVSINLNEKKESLETIFNLH